MKLKNVAKGGRGLGVAGHAPIEWAPGETKDVPDAVIVAAKKDPTNAALLDSGDLVTVEAQAKGPRVTVNDGDAEGAPEGGKAKGSAK